MVSTRQLKAIKGDNRLVFMLGYKLISHLIAFKHQKMVIAHIKEFSTENFSYWNWKKTLSREYFRLCSIHVCWNKEEICITHFLETILRTCRQKKRFTVLNEDKILAEEVKKFSCLCDKSTRLYQDRVSVRNAWV